MKTLAFKTLILILSFIIFINCESDDKDDDTKTEICNNGIDDDDNGFIDCADFECTCEICDNGIDDDGDGFTDGEDSDCSS